MTFGDWFGPALIAIFPAGIASWTVGATAAWIVFFLVFIGLTAYSVTHS